MRLREFSPSPWLQPYVRLIWSLELDEPGSFGPPERIAPDGIVELVFHYRRPMIVRFSGESYGRQPRSSMVFQTRRFIEIEPEGATGFISVRFQPWGAHPFLPLPLSELADCVVAAEQVWGGPVRELEERLAAAPSVRARVALVEQFLQRQFCFRGRPEVEALVRTIWRRRGNLGVAELCWELGFTERTLERVFAATLGMPPRSFIRLARFLHACSLMRRRECQNLTAVSYECGYFDQAHFIGDFKAYAGITPREFLTARAFSFLELK